MPENGWGTSIATAVPQRGRFGPATEGRIRPMTDPTRPTKGFVVEINDRRGPQRGGGTQADQSPFRADQKLPENLRPGAEASAKIMCGYRPVGYVLLCDAIAYVQRNILFRF